MQLWIGQARAVVGSEARLSAERCSVSDPVDYGVWGERREVSLDVPRVERLDLAPEDGFRLGR